MDSTDLTKKTTARESQADQKEVIRENFQTIEPEGERMRSTERFGIGVKKRREK
jgi:hypothetical protein